MFPQVEFGTEVQVRVSFLIKQFLFFSVIILDLLYEGKYLAVDYVSMSFLFVSNFVSANTFFSNFLKSLVRELYKKFSIVHTCRQYQFSEIHISPKVVNAFQTYFPYLLTRLCEILLEEIMSLYRTAVSSCFENRSSYRYILSIDLNRICAVFSAQIWKQKLWEFNIKAPSVETNLVIFGAIKNVHNFHICFRFFVKFCVMTLLVILSSISDFRGNRLWEILGSLNTYI